MYVMQEQRKSVERNFDDRSRKLVHLGTEPGSKAYRLFDPCSNRVVGSRDVIFKEEKAWRWNDMSDMKEFDAGGYELRLNTAGDDEHDHEVSAGETENNGETEHGETGMVKQSMTRIMISAKMMMVTMEITMATIKCYQDDQQE